MDVKKIAAELVGSFLFLSIGYLSVAAANAAATPTSALLIIPFGFGLGLLAAIYAFGHISGGHFNPAVTVAMVLDRRTDPIEAVGYIVAQIVGSVLAGAVVLVAVSQQAVAQGITGPGQGVSDVGALVIETVLSAWFILVILTSTRRSPAVAGIVIALTLAAIQAAAGTLSGASVNPVRSLGSAIVGGRLDAIWIYIVGPVVGAVIGWVVWKAIDGGGEQPAA